MKRYTAIILVLMLLVGIARAQDQQEVYRLNADACKPTYMLPDHDPSVSSYDDKSYTNEQLVAFCVTVTDQLGNIQTDPHFNNVVVSATDVTGLPVTLVHPVYKEQLPGDFPYEIVLVLDTSGSMSPSIRQMQQAALKAIRGSQLPDPYYSVITFNTKAEIAVGLTQNDQDVESAINAITVNRNSYTCLYDAVDEAVNLTRANQRSRRVVILFTDGKNEDKEGICKLSKDESVIKDAQLNGTSIFAIGLQGNSGLDKEQLNRLTQQANGSAQYGGVNELPALFEAILERLYSMRVMTALICGQGVITLTMQSSIGDKPALPTSTVLNLDNTQCTPPALLVEATATLEPTQIPDPVADVISFAIQPNTEAHDIAQFTVNFAGRDDIVTLKANIRDVENKDAMPGAQKCEPVTDTPGKFDCVVDVANLKAGKLTLSLYPYADGDRLLTQQPIMKDYSKEDVQPELGIESDGGNLKISISYPVSAIGAVFTVFSPAGVALPIPGTFSGAGPYQLTTETIDLESITVQADLKYGNTTRTVVSEPIQINRSFLQRLALWLRVNSLIVVAVVALGAISTAWLLRRRQAGTAAKDEDWLRSPVPEATKTYPKPPMDSVSKPTDNAATKVYNAKTPIGELELVRLASEPTRQGSRITVTSPFTVGRASTSDLVINDEFLSRSHFTIILRDGITFIKDMGSSNGTVVNHVSLSPQKEVILKDGDEIVLGEEITMHYRSKQEVLTRMLSKSK